MFPQLPLANPSVDITKEAQSKDLADGIKS